MSITLSEKVIEPIILKKLTEQFLPEVLFIENESHKHSSGKGAESHFKATIVSSAFLDKRPVARHQAVYSCLAEELMVIHALALHLYTPEEWHKQGQVVPASPNCLGNGQ